MRSLVSSLALLGLMLLLSSPVAAAENGSLNRTIGEFALPDSEGKEHKLADFGSSKLLAVVFVGTECPLANLYLPQLMELQARYHSAGLQVILINSNDADTPAEVAEHSKEFGISLPVLCDQGQMVADLFGATRTPEAFLLDAQRVIRYQGRIDDRYGYFHKRDEPTRYDLEEAIKELLAEKSVSKPQTEVAGCMISRPARPAGEASVTYAKEVSRIFQNKCQNCHRPGTSAPFSLLSYDDAANWAETIKEAILAKRMPPWHADPHHGTFSNDRRLTEAEIATLASWVDAGAPKGDDADLPPPRKFDESGWMIGEPDLVFQMPQEVTIPADGVVPYQYYQTETKFEEDVWISAAEARPGNRAVNHHIIVFVRSPKANLFDPEARLGGFLVGTAPGDMPLELPPGYARKIPAGSTLIWQMHYTPTGKVETDRSEVGLVLYKGKMPPKGVALTKGISNRFFKIPAGAAAHKVESQFTFNRDATLLSFMPHMHLRGKDFKYTAVFPDGTSEVLLSVPKYDFNWQSTYRLAQPRHLPKGTKIHCVAHFDNSVNNPANPDPSKPVFWGDQTWEEMMIGWIDFTYDEPGSTAQR